MKFLILLLILSIHAFSAVTRSEMYQIFDAVQNAYAQEFKEKKINLIFNQEVIGMPDFWWQQEYHRASFDQHDKDGETNFFIFIFGGLARIEGMTKLGLSLTICHELGHGLGGHPLKTTGNSTEGQSDYYSTRECFYRVLPHIKFNEPADDSETGKKICQDQANKDQCLYGISALKSHMEFLKTLDPHISLNKKDMEVAKSTNLSPYFYPNIQCRLDTLKNGLIGEDRPKCWYQKKSFYELIPFIGHPSYCVNDLQSIL